MRNTIVGTVDNPEILIATLLTLRGVDEKNQEAFFASDYGRDIHNPYELADMDKAVQRVMRAVKNKERIMVYGDYDADGITSTAIMMSVLNDIGAHAMPYLPHRYDDGYGLNGAVLKQAESEFDVLITVDCGIGNTAEVAMLQALGKDVIIVDHHELPDVLPEAYAILHPRHPNGSYPWGYLCGAGMSFKFAQALLRHEDSPHAHDADKEKWLLDLVMIGTIADVMPLLGENRAIVRFGKEVLMRTKRHGVRALLKEARIDPSQITAEDIAFRIVPLLNAAGRIGHPQSALNALLAQTPEQAKLCVKELISLNNKRRSMTKEIMDEAESSIDHELPFVFVANTGWHAGIVGLVAGRLASQFGKPAFVVGGLPVERQALHAVGSARGSGNVNVMTALETVRQYTLKLGGHAGAAGFSVLHENLEYMKEGLKEYFLHGKDVGEESSLASKTADMRLHPNLVTWDTARMLEKFEPFGEKNSKPSFLLEGLQVFSMKTVGKTGDHIKIKLLVGDKELDAIGFGLGKLAASFLISDVRKHNTVDVLASIGINEFQGRESLELRLHDIAPAGTVDVVITSP